MLAPADACTFGRTQGSGVQVRLSWMPEALKEEGNCTVPLRRAFAICTLPDSGLSGRMARASCAPANCVPIVNNKPAVIASVRQRRGNFFRCLLGEVFS